MKQTLAAGALLFAASAMQISAQEKGGDFHGDLRSVEMIDSKIGWAVGVSGGHAMLLRTPDGGKKWTDISPAPFRSRKVEVASDAENQIFLHLQDAAHGWTAVDQGGGEPNGPDETELLFSSVDGGHTWKRNVFRSSFGSIRSIAARRSSLRVTQEKRTGMNSPPALAFRFRR